jgi:NAD(P)-dependent dehydrogenase (short-subunit alcohol dehydrogenase family)
MLDKHGKAIVIGATGGIGAAVSEGLQSGDWRMKVFALGRRTTPPLDLEDETSIADAARTMRSEAPFDLVFVATGILHDDSRDIWPEKSWRHLDADKLARLFAVNATGPALVAKHFLPMLRKDRQSVFAAISARVGSISDNHLGGWYGYRASKAALNQIIRCLAIELKRTNGNGVCIGLHPGTVDTGLSKPFQASAKQLLTVKKSAHYLLDVLDHLEANDSGSVLAYDGNLIDP